MEDLLLTEQANPELEDVESRYREKVISWDFGSFPMGTFWTLISSSHGACRVINTSCGLFMLA